MRITALSIKVGSQPLHGKSMEAWKQALAMENVKVYSMEDGVIHAERFSDCYKKGNYNVAIFGNPSGRLLAITDENGMKRVPELAPAQKLGIGEYFNSSMRLVGRSPRNIVNMLCRVYIVCSERRKL